VDWNWVVTRVACLSPLALIAASLALSGCEGPEADDDPPPATDDPQSAVDDESAAEPETAEDPRAAQSNGFVLNGFILNGFVLNGFVLNGFVLNGADDPADAIQITKVQVNGGGKAEDTWLDGGNLHVQTKKGDVFAGADLAGAKIEFEVDEGGKKKKKIRINDVTPVSPGSDLLAYDIDVKIEAGPWQPLCADAQGDPVDVLLIDGVWSGATGARVHENIVDRVTFACRDAALAKCVEFGYVPWEALGGMTLEDLHQACTRMVRADYCGDGHAHTINGTPIHVLDEEGIQAADPNVSYVVEAEWGPDGATCLNAANTRITGTDPGCALPTCGSDFASGGLLQSGKILAP
jgi:hypothetical protein